MHSVRAVRVDDIPENRKGTRLQANEHEEMFRVEDFYWWFVGRRNLVEEIVARFQNSKGSGTPLKILDVGCGTGANLAMLAKYGEAIGVDSSQLAVDLCREHRKLDARFARVEQLPFPDAHFDIITAMDVLEHTDDDRQALKELRRVAKPDSLFISTVPAYNFLWSEHDEALQHRRRYVASTLRRRMTAAGFDVIRTSYFVTLLLLPILAVRIFQGLFRTQDEPKTSLQILPEWLNAIFAATLEFERALMHVFNLPVGVTVIAWARPRAEK